MICGILFGAICFFAGRFTGSKSPSEPSRVAVASPARPAGDSSAAAHPIPEPPTETQSPAKLAASASAWNEKEWQQLRSLPRNPARQATLAALLESLAATEPERALALAQGEGNLKLREGLVDAVLHGWARTSPADASRWALARSDANERERALSTVFAGAVAANPETAVALGKTLFQQNPVEAAGHGSSLIEALCTAGNFETAARMAAEGGAETRSGWMANAYSRWAEFQPEAAGQAASAIKDPALKNEALHGIVGGWSEAEPAALVQFVMQLPSETDRGPLLSQALERWAKRDPEGASHWLNSSEAQPELDEGVAAVATMDSLKPDVAVGWAESVANPKLRSETLVTVIRNWLAVDLPAARHYFETTQALLPDQRQELNEVFASFSRDSGAP